MGPCLLEFLAYLVTLCFDRRYPKQNTVARLKSNIFCPSPKLVPATRDGFRERRALGLSLWAPARV